MGDEVYDDPVELVSSLPERCLLSDFVESLDPVKNAVAKVKNSAISVLVCAVSRRCIL